MVGKFWLSAALAFASLAAMAPAAAQSGTTQPAPPTLTAGQIADGLQSMVGKPDDDGFLIQSVTAQGNMLIILFTGPDGWREGVDAGQVSGALVTGFCLEMTTYFDGGLTMRVDSVDRGVTLTGPVVTSCPQPAG
jgi:hypothetical protein